MKTSVELEIGKVDLAKRLGRVSTLRDLLDQALDAYIAQARRHSMADLMGSGFAETEQKTLRQSRGRSDR